MRYRYMLPRWWSSASPTISDIAERLDPMDRVALADELASSPCIVDNDDSSDDGISEDHYINGMNNNNGIVTSSDPKKSTKDDMHLITYNSPNCHTNDNSNNNNKQRRIFHKKRKIHNLDQTLFELDSALKIASTTLLKMESNERFVGDRIRVYRHRLQRKESESEMEQQKSEILSSRPLLSQSSHKSIMTCVSSLTMPTFVSNNNNDDITDIDNDEENFNPNVRNNNNITAAPTPTVITTSSDPLARVMSSYHTILTELETLRRRIDDLQCKRKDISTVRDDCREFLNVASNLYMNGDDNDNNDDCGGRNNILAMETMRDVNDYNGDIVSINNSNSCSNRTSDDEYETAEDEKEVDGNRRRRLIMTMKDESHVESDDNNNVELIALTPPRPVIEENGEDDNRRGWLV